MTGEMGAGMVSSDAGAYGPCAREETQEIGETLETSRVVCILDDGSPYRDKTFTPVGERRYLRMTAHGHPVAQNSGKVLVHRAVKYDALKAAEGDGPYTCYWCGWTDLDWFVDRSDPAYLIVDHRDGNSANNQESNLLATHKWCNDNRYVIEQKRLGWDRFKATPPGKRRALRDTRTGAPTQTADQLAATPAPVVSDPPPSSPPLTAPGAGTRGRQRPLRDNLTDWDRALGPVPADLLERFPQLHRLKR